MEWKPPRTVEAFYEVGKRIEENPEYFDRVKKFVQHIKPMEIYTLSRFVKPENMALFKDYICWLIVYCNFNLEFDDSFMKIRKC